MRIRLLYHNFLASPHRRETLPPLGMLVHRRFNLEPAVEIVLGPVDGDAPADFAVEIEPQEILVLGAEC